jgi:SHS2 domain-containing protein
VGNSQADLFTNSAFALFDVMTDVEKIELRERLPLEVEGADRDDLMVNWMRELLYLYQGSGYLLKEFEIHEVKDTSVKAEVSGEKIDPDRHDMKKEIPAVAYHQSRMEKTGNQWTAQLIFEY